MRQSAWRLAAAAVVLLAMVWIARLSFRPATRETATGPVLATLVTVRPPVRVQSAGSPARPIEAGEHVTAGTIVDTGADGRAAFALGNGASLRLDVDTRVVLDAASHVTLERGAVYVDSHGRRDGAGIDVRTAHGLVREIGTQFEVRTLAPGIRIRVREGEVAIDRASAARTTTTSTPPMPPTTAAEARVSVKQAEEVRLGSDGVIERRAILRHGPEWDWIDTIAPPFTLEGASLERFLEWVSREEGWTWRFADDAAAKHGTTVVLHGSIEGLTPAEALDAVLPTCGMTHQLRDGQLVVRLTAR